MLEAEELEVPPLQRRGVSHVDSPKLVVPHGLDDLSPRALQLRDSLLRVQTEKLQK